MDIKRNLYLTQLIDRKHNGLIKIISGIRRCGKSYLLFELLRKHLLNTGVSDDHIITIALDSYEEAKYCDPDLCYNFVKERIQDSEMYYLLLDEVQLMSNFESVLNGLMRIQNLDIYVTGSNSKFLSKDVVTEFRGRGDEVRVYPLSFNEFFSVFDGNWSDAWREYSVYGGMPLVVTYKKSADKMKYLKNLFRETYLKDIVARNNIKNTEELDELVNIVASGVGSLTNPQKLANTFKSIKKINLSAPAIKQYLDCLEDAFIVQKVLRYDIKGKKYMNTPYKYYFADPGTRNARLDFRQLEPTHIMENIIFNELNIRGYSVDVGNQVLGQMGEKGYERKTTEIDFVANQGSKRYYIQSVWNMPTEEKQYTEKRSLLEIRDSFKKIIIVGDDIEPYYDENGILLMGLKDFLLDPYSLEF
ncbi:MAG: ATP-binding protein [Alphaproteobacteria bacterium]|nr:ATP-binding protein [Alphaproteobacteria bacterium]